MNNMISNQSLDDLIKKDAEKRKKDNKNKKQPGQQQNQTPQQRL